ncbi:MAG: YbaB/EbfC family nucleoid-associated protein [Aquificae bacterium]|nr:YbaB/EbfC family nucleoid-associated protein [Aquificota bacterium]
MFNFGDLGNLMKQFKEIQENVTKAKQELAKEEIIVEVGGGMVKVTVNGLGEVLDLDIDKTLLSEENYQMLKDLLIAAMNEANERAKEVMSKKLSEATGLPSGIGNMGLL